MAPIIGIIIFVILIVLDIAGHRKFKVGRKPIDWLFLCLFMVFLALSVLLAVRSYLPEQTSGTPGRYLAYRYLMDGDAESARAVLLQDDSINEESMEFLNMLADAVDGDYKALYFASEKFAADSSAMPAQAEVSRALNDLAVTALEGGRTVSGAAEEFAEDSFNQSDIVETVELREYYEIDSLIRSGKAADVDPELIRTLPASFPEEESVKKLAVSYYVQTGDFTGALETAGVLLDEDESASNRVIYTDVLAEMAYELSEEDIRESGDEETAALLAKSDQAAEKAAEAEFGSEQYARQTESSKEYLEEIPKIWYQRIINYINVKKPVLGDKTGFYDLQIIKMELLAGNTDSAWTKMQELLGRADGLDHASSIRAELTALTEDMDLYYSLGDDDSRNAVFEDCERLMLSQCEGVVMVGEDNINVHAARLLASEIIYDRTIFEITGTDAASFPKVSVKVNTNLQKANIFGGAGEFYKDDFKVSENGEDYSDFTLTADMGTGDRCLVVAADISSGNANLMSSLFEAVRQADSSDMAKKLALVDGNAQMVCGFADSSDFYLTAARNLTSEGTASAYDMIAASAALLDEEKTEDPEILLISDNFDLTEDQAAGITGILKEKGITLYILNLSGQNSAEGETAAKNNGGLYFGLSLREELRPAVAVVKDLMNNGYIFTYKTADDITGAHTVTITLVEPFAEDSEGYLQEVNV